MAFKNLLVHIDDGKACTDRIQAAIALAQAHGAHLREGRAPRGSMPGEN